MKKEMASTNVYKRGSIILILIAFIGFPIFIHFIAGKIEEREVERIRKATLRAYEEEKEKKFEIKKKCWQQYPDPAASFDRLSCETNEFKKYTDENLKKWENKPTYKDQYYEILITAIVIPLFPIAVLVALLLKNIGYLIDVKKGRLSKAILLGIKDVCSVWILISALLFIVIFLWDITPPWAKILLKSEGDVKEFEEVAKEVAYQEWLKKVVPLGPLDMMLIALYAGAFFAFAIPKLKLFTTLHRWSNSNFLEKLSFFFLEHLESKKLNLNNYWFKYSNTLAYLALVGVGIFFILLFIGLWSLLIRDVLIILKALKLL